MPRKGFSEVDRIKAVQALERGAEENILARRLGVTPATLLRWRLLYSEVRHTEAQERQRLETENRRLRALVAQFAMENESLRNALALNAQASATRA